MPETITHLTLKRAAERSGVHEQTLRSWEKRGLIRMIKLPGSGYRRVPVTEIERLETTMNSSQSIADVRFVSPRRDQAALIQAQELAETVYAQLANLETTTDLDEFMSEDRGRTWLQ